MTSHTSLATSGSVTQQNVISEHIRTSDGFANGIAFFVCLNCLIYKIKIKNTFSC